MTVNSPVRASFLPFSTHLDSSLQNVGRALAGGDPRSIVLSEAAMRQHVLNRVFQEIGEECVRVCRRQPASRSHQFRWRHFLGIGLVRSWRQCAQFSFRHSRQLWRIQTTVTLERTEWHIIQVCVWQQLFYWRSEMVGVQSILSLVLFNSRVAKNVSFKT